MTDKIARCITCNQEFTKEEIKGFDKCPKCGDKGLPASPKDDVTIKINWHELRILCMWAERWAAQAKDESEIRMDVALACIAERLQKQFPKRPPLTVAGEMEQLKKHFTVVETNINDKPGKIAKEFNA